MANFNPKNSYSTLMGPRTSAKYVQDGVLFDRNFEVVTDINTEYKELPKVPATTVAKSVAVATPTERANMPLKEKKEKKVADKKTKIGV